MDRLQGHVQQALNRPTDGARENLEIQLAKEGWQIRASGSDGSRPRDAISGIGRSSVRFVASIAAI